MLMFLVWGYTGVGKRAWSRFEGHFQKRMYTVVRSGIDNTYTNLFYIYYFIVSGRGYVYYYLYSTYRNKIFSLVNSPSD